MELILPLATCRCIFILYIIFYYVSWQINFLSRAGIKVVDSLRTVHCLRLAGLSHFGQQRENVASTRYSFSSPIIIHNVFMKQEFLTQL